MFTFFLTRGFQNPTHQCLWLVQQKEVYALHIYQYATSYCHWCQATTAWHPLTLCLIAAELRKRAYGNSPQQGSLPNCSRYERSWLSCHRTSWQFEWNLCHESIDFLLSISFYWDMPSHLLFRHVTNAASISSFFHQKSTLALIFIHMAQCQRNSVQNQILIGPIQLFPSMGSFW